MTKTTDIPNEKKEVNQEYVKLHNRSLRQIAADVAKKTKEQATEIKVEEKKEDLDEKIDDIRKKKREDREKEREENETKRVEEVAKKTAEETAVKVTAETKKAFQEEIAKILDKDKALIDKQKEADELITSWDKEKRLPKDYKELIDETMRVADAKMEQKLRARQEEETRVKQENEAKETERKVELEKKQGEERLAEFNKQIVQDLDDIYNANLLPRPDKFEEVNNPDTKDDKAKETQKLLEFGVKLNVARQKEGKPPVTSLAKIYFLHYKPEIEKSNHQPPGADAPVAGANNSPGSGSSEKINMAQLRKETWAQTAFRIAREQARKLAEK